MIRVSILGATGYSGGELLRLLLKHPAVRIQHVTSEASAGRKVTDIHASLQPRTPLRFEKINGKRIAKDSDVVFSCLPSGLGIKVNAHLVKSGIKVIDLSADFRLPTSKLYRTWYKQKHAAPHLLKRAVYGLPEIFRNKIKDCDLIANPGCYATAALISVYPLLKSKILDPKSIVVDAKSGVSGAGKKLSAEYLFTEVDENLKPYSVASHRHQPEMENIMARVGGVKSQTTFNPHLVPMNRGILSALYGTLKKPMKLRDIRSLFLKTYEMEPFIRVLPEGDTPQTKNVIATNNCEIGIFEDTRMRRVIVIAAIDNLIKGAAGQAIQNMNLCFGRSEAEGLL